MNEGLKLVNELIRDTGMERKLIEWKRNQNIYFKDASALGTVGTGYWRKFLKRHRHRLRSKSGKKFGCDRANYSGYLNFVDMYQHIADILVNEAKIATKYETPVWVDKDGVETDDEMKAYGCKADIFIHRPDMGLMMDEVGVWV